MVCLGFGFQEFKHFFFFFDTTQQKKGSYCRIQEYIIIITHLSKLVQGCIQVHVHYGITHCVHVHVHVVVTCTCHCRHVMVTCTSLLRSLISQVCQHIFWLPFCVTCVCLYNEDSVTITIMYSHQAHQAH